MNRTAPWGTDTDAAHGADLTGASDHTAEMRAIALQLERLSGSVGRTGGREAPQADAGRLDALRDAVAAISRRQADLDGDEVAGEPMPVSPRPAPKSAPEPSPEPVRVHVPAPQPIAPAPLAATSAPQPAPAAARGSSGLRRAGIDLSAEVSQTFARFSRDLHDAIRSTDARPGVESLGREMRQIGQAVDGLGSRAPSADALARIGEQTREMRDLLKASTARSVPFDAVERQVASLEARLGRLAAMPAPAAPPELGETMAEVRALLDGFNPGATMAALESRLDAITNRIERGLDARGPAGLIEGLSRRVDEIHTSLRSQLAEAAVDTRPLESLVRGLSDRIGQARDASTNLHQLEAAVRDVSAKIDGAGAGVDARGVQAIEAQLARLSERLDRSEASLRSLDGVEHTLGELFSQFEVTRQVAIDAAETAARTAARDTLRAALQNPNLAHHRPSEVPSTAVDQMARSLDDIRALQDTAERRTQSALSDIQIAMDRLVDQMAAGPGGRATARDETRRQRVAAEPVAEARPALDPADQIIEPGSGRIGTGQPSRTEPRFDAAPEAPTLPPNDDADGPASFIAAARRAAQAAQASAASTAAVKAADRRQATRTSAPRAKALPGAVAAGAGALGRARSFLAQRRRPILLSLAALVLLVGALELVKVGGESPAEATRVSEVSTRTRPVSAPVIADAGAAKAADLPKLVLPPAAIPTAAPLPTFVTGSAKAPAPADGIPDGLRTAAAAGDAGAQYEVGLRYSEGRGVARDPQQAAAWFSKAAASGSAPAEYRLGSAYEKGAGVERDPALAMSWYGKAAEAGNIRAMHNLAVMSAEGAGGKPDYAKAAQWFGKASTYGVRDSQFNLAILYARGLGIEQSLPQSYTWFAIAAAEGDEDAAKKRDEVAGKLDAKALAAAKSAAEAFRAAVPPASANEVTPPPGGWDAAPRATPSANAKVSQL
ncbi:tetratricopeptide repeat protein [Lichenibacterium dinghuense]|uniref:tetratricopeptide repeat protein n=1 Tax=Lichenibacterium dinghuense TaxID=2895977 RepID=UPI001F1AC062|nr:tetratricopeptide repeat protein [Lichenibacterium sp. 6Y81]